MSGFDNTIFNQRERPLSADLNDLQSLAARSSLDAMLYAHAEDVLDGNDQPIDTAFLDVVLGGLQVVPLSAQTVNVLPGAVAQYSQVIPPVPNPAVDSFYRLGFLRASVSAPRPSGGADGWYLVRAQVTRTVTVTETRDVLNPATGQFEATPIPKRAEYSLTVEQEYVSSAGPGAPPSVPPQMDWVPLALVYRGASAPVAQTDIHDVRPRLRSVNNAREAISFADKYSINRSLLEVRGTSSKDGDARATLDFAADPDNAVVMVGNQGMIRSGYGNGTDWIMRTPAGGYSETFSRAAFGAGTFVIVGRYGEIQTSETGINWTRRATGEAYDLQALIYAGGVFLAAGSNGVVRKSSDGISWTTHSSSPHNISDLTYADGVFYASVSTSATVLSSTDGESWTAHTPPTDNAYLRSITYSPERKTLVALGPTEIIYSRDKGVTWVAVPTPDNVVTLNRVRAVSGMFVAIGSNYRVTMSADGSLWEPAIIRGSIALHALYQHPVHRTVFIGGDGNSTYYTPPLLPA